MIDLEEIIQGITFPGIMAHELGHMVFCKVCGVKIKKFSLFRPLQPLGYVSHAKPKKLFQEFLIVMGPLFFNTIVALALFSSIRFFQAPYSWIVLWLGFSIAYNAFPSTWPNPTVRARASVLVSAPR